MSGVKTQSLWSHDSQMIRKLLYMDITNNDCHSQYVKMISHNSHTKTQDHANYEIRETGERSGEIFEALCGPLGVNKS